MRTTTLASLTAFLLLIIIACTQTADLSNSSTNNPPKVFVEGSELSLLTKEPDISTPTGIQIDAQNRIWVIENHTHVRQDDYPGPEVDRILVFSGYLREGERKSVTEFATDFVDGMSLSLTRDGKVLISTRASIMQFTDEDGDLLADRRDTLIALQTEEHFPHNGMSGLAVSPDGKLYFQCGENFGSEYLISGTDGIVLHGKEREGGSLYRCNADGSHLERIGSAVWNCFAMTFDDYGNLFAVENDPDSRPPCRLLHIVKGGNYGFQFQHGRDGLSPLTSWFGQIPGTLPMVAGTGEAPSGVLYYDQDHFGVGFNNSLLVTGWGDNDIQSFQLKPRGSSFTAESRLFTKGGRNFYPVGLALDNQGGVVASDWADVSYAVHGKGRIWRVANPSREHDNYRLKGSEQPDKAELIILLNQKDPRVRADAADAILAAFGDEVTDFFQDKSCSGPGKMDLIWAAKRANHPTFQPLLNLGLDENNELLRAAVVRILIDEKIKTNEEFSLFQIRKEDSPYVIREAIYGLQSQNAFASVVDWFGKDDPFIHAAIISTFGKKENVNYLKVYAGNPDSGIRLGALLCLRQSEETSAQTVIPAFLNDSKPINRLTALKWVAEDQLKKYRPQVEASFNRAGDISPELFDAYMVCFQYLDGEFNQKNHFMEGDEHVSQSFYKRQKFLLNTAKNAELNFAIRARALSAINPVHEDLSVERLQQFAQTPNTVFQIEALRSIRERTGEDEAVATQVLQQAAQNAKNESDLRLEAIVGLAKSASKNEETKQLLIQLASQKRNQEIREEAMRSLQALNSDPEVKPLLATFRERMPSSEEGGSEKFWKGLAKEQGNTVAGARTFFNARYQCSNCHRINGRGGIFGPDLSQVGSNANTDRIVESLLDPSAIVTPTYSGYSVLSEDRKTTIGRLDEALDSKRHLQMILVNGERARVAYDEMVEQKLLPQSLMPANLHRMMTAEEFRDLIQYLSEQK